MADADNQLLRPDGRVIMVSGANRGIGRAIVERLYNDGYTLSLGARDPASIGDMGATSQVMTHVFDATIAETARIWVAATVAHFGRLDGLVNNAGLLLNVTLDEGDEEALDAMWEVNAKAPFRLIRHAMPHLRKSGCGRIVNIISTAGLRHKGGSFGYSMSKSAALALTQATRLAGWDDGIRVTAVCPGQTATDMAIGSIPEDVIPVAEMTPPQVIAHAVAMVLGLPNTASVAVLPIHSMAEPTI